MRRAFSSFPIVVAALLAALFLSACGQKGPLKLPENKPASSTPATAPAPSSTPAPGAK